MFKIEAYYCMHIAYRYSILYVLVHTIVTFIPYCIIISVAVAETARVPALQFLRFLGRGFESELGNFGVFFLDHPSAVKCGISHSALFGRPETEY